MTNTAFCAIMVLSKLNQLWPALYQLNRDVAPMVSYHRGIGNRTLYNDCRALTNGLADDWRKLPASCWGKS